jgi:multidrug transporter EmrE-like cation transporter
LIKILPIFLLYVALSASGFLFLKKAENVTSASFFLGNAFYVSGYLIWALVLLRALPLSVAFPIASAGLLITSQIVGYYFLDERVDLINMIALVFMLIGLGFMFSKV